MDLGENYAKGAVMRKWGFFSMGIMAGIIFVLAFLLLAQHYEQVAYASSSPQGVGAGGGGTFIATGGTGQNQTDMVWILYRRGKARGTGKEAAAMAKLTGPNRLTLCAYRMGQGGRPKMMLLSARDISYDVEMLEYNNSGTTVNTVIKELRKRKKK